MNKMTIAAIAVAAVLLAAGAYVVMSMGNTPKDKGTDGGDSNPQSDAVDSKNKTLAVAFPAGISDSDRKMALSMTYPGKGNESDYTYKWNEPYQFSLNATPASGYTGNVLIKMFAEKSGEIGTNNLKVKDFQGKDVNWTLNIRNGAQTLYNVIGGDIASWKTNGTASVRSFEVSFLGTGNYTLYIQAFDLDSGRAISDPVTAKPLYVPVTGELTVKALTRGTWETTANGTYYKILINITNDWNIRYDVLGTNLVLSNGTDEVHANTTAMVFKAQSLAPKQSTEFQAYFDIQGDRNTFVLQYWDSHSGEIISVPLPPATVN